MTKQTLVADIEEFVRKSEARVLAVIRNSLQDVTEMAQTPTAKGGRMRVDTGFLRASGRAALGSMPSGPNVKPADAPVGQYTGIYDNWSGESVQAVLVDMKLGDTFFFGWTANYAETRELYDGFLVSATQDWQNIVNRNSERFRGK